MEIDRCIAYMQKTRDKGKKSHYICRQCLGDPVFTKVDWEDLDKIASQFNNQKVLFRGSAHGAWQDCTISCSYHAYRDVGDFRVGAHSKVYYLQETLEDAIEVAMKRAIPIESDYIAIAIFDFDENQASVLDLTTDLEEWHKCMRVHKNAYNSEHRTIDFCMSDLLHAYRDYAIIKAPVCTNPHAKMNKGYTVREVEKDQFQVYHNDTPVKWSDIEERYTINQKRQVLVQDYDAFGTAINLKQVLFVKRLK